MSRANSEADLGEGPRSPLILANNLITEERKAGRVSKTPPPPPPPPLVHGLDLPLKLFVNQKTTNQTNKKQW